ncbi:MAG TPA: carboxymuconolactone decarboxylase family protein, partial [Mycobacterium sp.]|nr:carboxymuconolactone decarboxylase family protein [Mycobacterium sp.]
DPAALTDDQQELFDLLSNTLVAVVNSVGGQAATDDGRLIGPFNPALYSPAISAKFVELQMFELTHTTLNERVRQVVILAVGSVWRADYELYAHSAAARAAGISEHAVEALANGEIPDELTDEEKIAARLARQLSSTHRVDDALYREAEKAFDKQGLVDIAALIGAYHGVCTTLTLFEVPAPA